MGNLVEQKEKEVPAPHQAVFVRPKIVKNKGKILEGRKLTTTQGSPSMK